MGYNIFMRIQIIYNFILHIMQIIFLNNKIQFKNFYNENKLIKKCISKIKK